jgi:hypothetical protein
MLIFPVRKIWVSADYDDHGYNALDLGWWDYDASMPEDTGRNPRLYAMADGVVVSIVNSHPDEPDWNGYGNYIIIRYPNEGYVSLFAHIKKDSFMVKVGDVVKQGQPVCRMGNSGYSYGNHLHLELSKGSSFIRHGGVDFIPIVYATDWHVVDSDSQKEYNIRHMVLEPKDRDVTKRQLKVTCDDLNIRTEPSVKSKSAGFAQQGYYDVDAVVLNEGIVWNQVDKYYMALTEGTESVDAEFIPVEPDTTKNQCEVTIDDLRIRYDHSTSSTIMGYCPIGYYDVEETWSDDEYVWFKVWGYWIAFVDGVIYHGSQEDPKDKKIRELEEEVSYLEKENSDLKEEVGTLDNRCDAYVDVLKGIKEICESAIS